MKTERSRISSGVSVGVLFYYFNSNDILQVEIDNEVKTIWTYIQTLLSRIEPAVYTAIILSFSWLKLLYTTLTSNLYTTMTSN